VAANVDKVVNRQWVEFFFETYEKVFIKENNEDENKSELKSTSALQELADFLVVKHYGDSWKGGSFGESLINTKTYNAQKLQEEKKEVSRKKTLQLLADQMEVTE